MGDFELNCGRGTKRRRGRNKKYFEIAVKEMGEKVKDSGTSGEKK